MIGKVSVICYPSDSQWVDEVDLVWTAMHLAEHDRPVWTKSVFWEEKGCVPEFGLWIDRRWPEEVEVLI